MKTMVWHLDGNLEERPANFIEPLQDFGYRGNCWFLWVIIKEKQTRFVLAVSAIFAGALGNMIDSAFYGVIFSESFTDHAVYFSGRILSFMEVGRYVLFPIIETTWPSWSPIRPVNRYFSGRYLISRMPP